MKSPVPPTTVRDILVERLESLLAECDRVMDDAQFGQIFHDLDDFLLVAGKKFLQELYQEKLQERIQQAEQNAETKQCSDCKKKTEYLNTKAKTFISAHGAIRLKRQYRYCSCCDTNFFPVEAAFGLTTPHTTALTRLVSRCCGLWSYRLAAENLQELCGIYLSHATVGNIAVNTAENISDRLKDNVDIRNTFQKAKGEIEFYADGVFVHTRHEEGKAEYREFKIGALVKRECGAFALPSEWATRKLPDTTVVSAFASIVDKEEFQERCQKMRRSLGVGGVSSALGDGAKWIWNVSQVVFGKSDECLDIYHGAQHISDCGKVLFGESQASKDWFERMRLVLLSEGFPGMERELQLLGTLEEKQQATVDTLLEYLKNNAQRLNYAERLAMGRAIGSGLIEGACKNLIGKRLKQTGACWRVPRANRIAILCATLYSNQWKQAWKNTY